MPGRTILVKIASYRDREVITTMAACLETAARPNDIRFAVVNQYGPETADVLEPVRSDPRVQIFELPWQSSRGLGYARQVTDEMYRGEDFTLQIDAHMRFSPGWDHDLIRQWDTIGNDRAVLSCYPGAYATTQGNDVRASPAEPHAIVIQGTDEFHLPGITNGPRTEPFSSALLVAGCFQFASGSATVEVPAHGEILIGDESVHSLRLFTHGYDVTVPDNVPLFHRYAREKEWEGGAFTPFVDFRASDELWATFSTLLRKSVSAAHDVLGRPDHPSLGKQRTHQAFCDALHNFCLPDVAVPIYSEQPRP